MLDETDPGALDDICAQHLDLSIPGGLRSLCVQPGQAERGDEPVPVVLGAQRGSMLSRVLNRLRGSSLAHRTHHYALYTKRLLLSIITRRADAQDRLRR